MVVEAILKLNCGVSQVDCSERLLPEDAAHLNIIYEVRMKPHEVSALRCVPHPRASERPV